MDIAVDFVWFGVADDYGGNELKNRNSREIQQFVKCDNENGLFAYSAYGQAILY